MFLFSQALSPEVEENGRSTSLSSLAWVPRGTSTQTLGLLRLSTPQRPEGETQALWAACMERAPAIPGSALQTQGLWGRGCQDPGWVVSTITSLHMTVLQVI